MTTSLDGLARLSEELATIGGRLTVLGRYVAELDRSAPDLITTTDHDTDCPVPVGGPPPTGRPPMLRWPDREVSSPSVAATGPDPRPIRPMRRPTTDPAPAAPPRPGDPGAEGPAAPRAAGFGAAGFGAAGFGAIASGVAASGVAAVFGAPAPGATGPAGTGPVGSEPPDGPRLPDDGAAGGSSMPRVLAWVGAAVTMVGVVLLVILAVQRGWLGPVPRVLGGALLAAGLYAAGVRLRRTPGGAISAPAVAATGIATAYLDALGATVALHLLPAWAGLLIAIVIAAVGMATALRWRLQPLAVGTVLGAALLAPVLAPVQGTLLVPFLLVLALGSAPVVARTGWHGLLAAGALPPAIAALIGTGGLITGGGLGASGSHAVLTAVMAAAVGVSAVVAVSAAGRRPADDVLPALIIVVDALPALFAAAVVARPLAIPVLVVLALVYGTVWLAGARWPRLLPAAARDGLSATTAAVLGTLTAVTLFELAGVAASGWVRPAAVLAGSAAVAAAGARARITGMTVTAIVGIVLGWLELVTRYVPLTWLLRAHPFGPAPGPGALIASLLLLVAAAALAMPRPGGAVLPDGTAATMLVVITGAGVYGTAATVLSAAQLVAPGPAGFVVGQVLVTLLWAGASLVLLAVGAGRRMIQVIAVTLASASVAKLVLVDLATLDGVARVGAFLGAGLLLLAAGTRYARTTDSGTQSGR